jgi:hypothetical protein
MPSSRLPPLARQRDPADTRRLESRAWLGDANEGRGATPQARASGPAWRPQAPPGFGDSSALACESRALALSIGVPAPRSWLKVRLSREVGTRRA